MRRLQQGRPLLTRRAELAALTLTLTLTPTLTLTFTLTCNRAALSLYGVESWLP